MQSGNSWEGLVVGGTPPAGAGGSGREGTLGVGCLK